MNVCIDFSALSSNPVSYWRPLNLDVIFVRAFVALELLAGCFHAAETSNTLGCVCCCPACWKCLTQQQTGLCFVVPALIHPFSGELAEVSFCWSQLHQVMFPLRFWVWEILEQTWHFCALGIMEEGMAATSWNSQEQQPELCAMFWLAGSR